jgi:hypothetical protein
MTTDTDEAMFSPIHCILIGMVPLVVLVLLLLALLLRCGSCGGSFAICGGGCCFFICRKNVLLFFLSISRALHNQSINHIINNHPHHKWNNGLFGCFGDCGTFSSDVVLASFLYAIDHFIIIYIARLIC